MNTYENAALQENLKTIGNNDFVSGDHKRICVYCL